MKISNKELEYWIRLIKHKCVQKQSEVEFIIRNSTRPKLIVFIYLVEQIHRGDIFTVSIEKFLIRFLPSIVIKFDYSIGLFQIKPSFCLRYSSKSILLKEHFKLDKCIEILNVFLEENKGSDDVSLIRQFHSGSMEVCDKSTYCYIYLYKWFEENFTVKPSHFDFR